MDKDVLDVDAWIMIHSTYLQDISIKLLYAYTDPLTWFQISAIGKYLSWYFSALDISISTQFQFLTFADFTRKIYPSSKAHRGINGYLYIMPLSRTV